MRHREGAAEDGPAVPSGNHNSNIHALAIMSLMPLRLLPKAPAPVAAMDYSASSISRLAMTNIIGIIPA